MKKEKKICTQIRIPHSTYKELKKITKEIEGSQNQFILNAIRIHMKNFLEAKEKV